MRQPVGRRQGQLQRWGVRDAAAIRGRYDAGIVVNFLVYLGNHLTHGLMLLRTAQF